MRSSVEKQRARCARLALQVELQGVESARDPLLRKELRLSGTAKSSARKGDRGMSRWRSSLVNLDSARPGQSLEGWWDSGAGLAVIHRQPRISEASRDTNDAVGSFFCP